ncbi:hypothetical protein AB0873_09115 [Micromonospora sp. NPDC047707]|uniref:hypothetical protein n=1 Tax=Micromonospora sp. NPDC047707 TaxID=3154498 RepID=UPI003455712A
MRRWTFRPPSVTARAAPAPRRRGLPATRIAALLGAVAGAFFLSALLGADPATAGDRTGATPNTIPTPAVVTLLERAVDAVDPPGPPPAPRGTGRPPMEAGEADRGRVLTSSGRRGRSPGRAGVAGADPATATDLLAARAARVTRGMPRDRDDARGQRRGDERKRDRSGAGAVPVAASAVVRPVTTKARAVRKPAVTGGTTVVGPLARTARSTTAGVLTRVTGAVGVAVPVLATSPVHPGEPSSPRATVPDAPTPAAASGTVPPALPGPARPAAGTTGPEGAAHRPPRVAGSPLAPAPASDGGTWCPEPSGETSAGTVPRPAAPPPGAPTAPDDDCATTTDGGGGPASPPAVAAERPTRAGRAPVRPSVAPGDRLAGTDARPG